MVELQSLLSKMNTLPEDVVGLLRLDSNLSLRVLKLANSAAFSVGRPSDTIDDAVIRLGYNQISEIVATLAASDLLRAELELYRMDSGQLLYESLATAIASTSFNQIANFGDGCEVIFTVGLLHALGKPILNDYMLKHHASVLKNSKHREFLPEQERALFGIDFSQVSAAALSKWNFSAHFVRLVKNLLDDWQTHPQAKELAVLRLGIASAPAVLNPSANIELSTKPEAKFLKLNPVDIEDALANARKTYEVLSTAL